MSDSHAKPLADYIAGTTKLRASLVGMTSSDLAARPGPGAWSTQEVVMHVTDAEDAFIDRMRRIIAMDKPLLEEWHETKFAERLHYEKQSVEDACTRFEAGRRNLIRVLNALPPEDYLRYGTHSARGPQTLGEVLGFSVWHLDHHLKFIAEKRKALGH